MSDAQDLAGKVAFVTGGSSGIGRGIALALAGAGATTIVTGRSEAHLQETVAEFAAAGLPVETMVLDVTDDAAVQAAAAEVQSRHGRVDILVNNAGIGLTGPVAKATADDWRWVVDVNILGVGSCIRAFLPLIQQHGDGGAIVNTSSMAALMPSVAGLYSMTKAGIVALSEAMNIELADEGIVVSAYCPGPVRSNIAKGVSRRPAEYGASGYAAPDPAKLVDPELLPYMSYAEAGQRVLEGIRRKDMFILTHNEFRDGVRERFDTVVGAFPDEPVDTERAAAITFLTGHPAYAPEQRNPAPRHTPATPAQGA